MRKFNRLNSLTKLTGAALACVLLVACQNSGPAFHRMDRSELQAYNDTVEVPDMVYCFEEVRTGSFIKKKYCLTLQEIADALEDNSNYVGTINYDGGGRAFTPGYNRN
ncbi:MAG: hypothetical protein O2971_01040 [Proteobacteria bacterium]|nr:hypothetical protein [Pseudomonadota bacterium]